MNPMRLVTVVLVLLPGVGSAVSLPALPVIVTTVGCPLGAVKLTLQVMLSPMASTLGKGEGRHEAVAPVGSEAVLAFVPPLRASVPAGALLGLDAPSVLLRLTAPVPTVIGRADQHRFTISAREAL